MISGQLSTMSLTDLLQWADANRVRGTLTLERASGDVWMEIMDRSIVGGSESLANPVPVQAITSGKIDGELAIDPSALALEQLYDLFFDSDGSFMFEPNVARVTGIALEISLQEFVMEGLRHLDEWPRIGEMYRDDNATLTLVELGESGLRTIHRALLSCAERGLSIANARLALGLSRPAVLRRIDELRQLGRIDVAGTPQGGDLTAKLIGQATHLLHAKQFDEAAHVFGALLAADPGATRVKDLLREAQREQILSLYEELPPDGIPHLLQRDVLDNKRINATDREVLQRVNGRWDVAVLVLACPLREVETLKSLRKLIRLRAIELR